MPVLPPSVKNPLDVTVREELEMSRSLGGLDPQTAKSIDTTSDEEDFDETIGLSNTVVESNLAVSAVKTNTLTLLTVEPPHDDDGDDQQVPLPLRSPLPPLRQSSQPSEGSLSPANQRARELAPLVKSSSDKE